MLKETLKKIISVREKDLGKETHINRALRHTHGTIYLEIGVNQGVCFQKIHAARKIGIDPSPLPTSYSLSSGESFYQMTSDEFFAQHLNKALEGLRIDVAFVDGLHEFEQALRDILNLERFMSPKGVIFIHDCNPTKRELAEKGHGVFWTGDVWKVAYYLRAFRKDLRFLTLNCDWGLGILSGFGRSRKARSPVREDIANVKTLDYGVLEQSRNRILRLRPPWYSRIIFSVLEPLAH